MDTPRNLSIHLIAFAAFSALCYFGATVIITVVLAVLVAYLLDPFVNLLRRIHIPKGIAISIVLIIACVLLATILSLVIDRAQEFSESLPRYGTKIQKVTRDIHNRILALQKKSEDISKTILPKSTKEQKPLQIQFYSTWQEFLFRNLGPYLIQMSFFPFLVYFLLLEKDKIRLFVSGLVRSRTNLSHTFVQGTSDKIVNDLNKKIRGFVLGYLLSTAILFVVAWLLFLSFRVEEGLIWAILFALFNVIPFVGAFLATIPPIFIAILQFTSIQKGILFVALCMGLHLIYANWLIPRTTGPRTELSPLVVLIAMMYWGFLWGAIGIFLAIPITASLRSVWIQYLALQRANFVAAERERMGL